MQDAIHIPPDREGCKALILAQAEANSQQQAKIEALESEMEKLRKLLSHFVNGQRSEKRVVTGPEQNWLPFGNSEEFQAARAEAEAQAEIMVDAHTRQREVPKKPRDESFPSHLRRVEQIVEGNDAEKTCAAHGDRTIIGYDTTETLVEQRPELYVLVKKYAKYACAGHSDCGVTSPARPTSLVEGDRYDTGVAASIIEAKWFHHMPLYRQQDRYCVCGWTPSRSTLTNIVGQVDFVVMPLIALMTQRVQQDIAVGLDDTTCRMLLPQSMPEAIPGDPKSQRLAEKVAESRAKREKSLLARMWAYSGLHQAPYNIFDFRVSRHRDGPDEFFRTSRCKVLGDCFSGNTSVVIHSDERLEFVACWAHARRKVLEASTYETQRDTLLGMIQALYDVETRAKDMTWQERQSLRQRESTVILAAIKNWLDTRELREVLPKTDFAEALRYLNNHWEALNVFTSDGRVPMDNNVVEHLMRQVAMGRKAWLFVCNVPAGEQSARMMTLVSSARRHDLDVAFYIKDILDKLLAGSTDYQSLLPDVWKQQHPEAVRHYRAAERKEKADQKQLRAARRRLLAKALRRR